jgi:hypothetical protein
MSGFVNTFRGPLVHDVRLVGLLADSKGHFMLAFKIIEKKIKLLGPQDAAKMVNARAVQSPGVGLSILAKGNASATSSHFCAVLVTSSLRVKLSRAQLISSIPKLRDSAEVS